MITTDQFVAEIRQFPYTFAPKGWAMCNGQLLPISQNTALFSLLGTTYGGDGKSTFGLPDLQGATAMHPGDGPGLSPRFLGGIYGAESVTLLEPEIPNHHHELRASTEFADLQAPGPTRVIARSQNALAYQANTTSNLGSLAPQQLAPTGGDLPHNNMQPYLVLNFCIALVGIFPPRS